jgi:hypothetical protein
MESFPVENKIEHSEPPLISKDFFALQLEFAKELYRQAKQKNPELNLIDTIKRVAPQTTWQAIEYDKNTNTFADVFKTGITEENILDEVYENYRLEEKAEVENIDPYDGPNRKFGPLFYVTPEDETPGEEAGKDNISFHFSNDYKLSSAQLLNIEERKKDIQSMLNDIKLNHPKIKTLSTASWLLDAIPESIMIKLFPQSFIDSIRVKETKVGWRLGTMIWGQFLDARGNVKKRLADELLNNVRNMQEGEYLIDLLKPPLHKPKSAIAPIDDFFTMYNV